MENKQELIDAQEIDQLMPQMNVNMPIQQQQENNLISDEALLGVYDEIMTNLRDDRKEISNVLDNFTEMVINGGDGTSASKEALVNLIKIKSDTADKMAKVADLMSRIYMNRKNTFPAYLNQENHIKIEGTKLNKRRILEIMKNKDSSK